MTFFRVALELSKLKVVRAPDNSEPEFRSTNSHDVQRHNARTPNRRAVIVSDYCRELNRRGEKEGRERIGRG